MGWAGVRIVNLYFRDAAFLTGLGVVFFIDCIDLTIQCKELVYYPIQTSIIAPLRSEALNLWQ